MWTFTITGRNSRHIYVGIKSKQRASETVILAYILAIITWWISTFLLVAVLELPVGVLLIFSKRARWLREMERQLLDGDHDRFDAIGRAYDGEFFLAENAFYTATKAATQIVAFLAGEWIFRLCGLQASHWLALPFGLLCLLSVVNMSVGKRPTSSRLRRAGIVYGNTAVVLLYKGLVPRLKAKGLLETEAQNEDLAKLIGRITGRSPWAPENEGKLKHHNDWCYRIGLPIGWLVGTFVVL